MILLWGVARRTLQITKSVRSSVSVKPVSLALIEYETLFSGLYMFIFVSVYVFMYVFVCEKEKIERVFAFLGEIQYIESYNFSSF